MRVAVETVGAAADRPIAGNAARGWLWLLGTLTLLGSFLLFLVQPIFAATTPRQDAPWNVHPTAVLVDRVNEVPNAPAREASQSHATSTKQHTCGHTETHTAHR